MPRSFEELLSEEYDASLTREEVAEALGEADAINGNHRTHGDGDQLNAGRARGEDLSLDMDRLGQLGDRLACKVLGMEWITRRRDDRKDDGYDSLLMGQPVEVKTTTFDPKNQSLIVKDLSKLKSLVLVMVRYDVATDYGRCTGWVSVREFRERHQKKVFVPGRPSQHYMRESDLRPMSTLVPMLERYAATSAAEPVWDKDEDDWEPPSWVREEAAEARTRPRDHDPSLDAPKNVGLADSLEALIPDEYRGKTWGIQYSTGSVECRFPPMRDDPQGPVIQPFIDFQDHGGRVAREAHPGRYCVECASVQVAAICPTCKVNWNDPTGAPRNERGTPHKCRKCQGTFDAPMVCHPCREKLKERYGGQLALAEPVLIERKAGKRKRLKEHEDNPLMD